MVKYKVFLILPKIDEFLKSNKVDYKEFLPDEYHSYEVILFEMIDEDNDGKPDNKFSKLFKVIYYGIIERWKDKIPEGFDDTFIHKKKNILGNCQQIVSETKNHSSFGIKY